MEGAEPECIGSIWCPAVASPLIQDDCTASSDRVLQGTMLPVRVPGHDRVFEDLLLLRTPEVILPLNTLCSTFSKLVTVAGHS